MKFNGNLDEGMTLMRKQPHLMMILLIGLSLPLCPGSRAQAGPNDPLDACNVVWDTPSKEHNGSMPIGNGDIGMNVWVDTGGNLWLLLSKTDAWSENCRLLKLGRVRVRLTPNPFVDRGASAGMATALAAMREKAAELFVHDLHKAKR